MRSAQYVIGACALVLTASVMAQDRPKAFRSGDPGVTVPTATKQVHATYTREALEARIQGVVGMDAVVLEDGTVGDVTITQSLDEQYGLDQQAVKAMKQWRFKPGTKDEKPVPVIVSVTMSFALR
jgi:TonB family protein